jgi:hypothetical protein
MDMSITDVKKLSEKTGLKSSHLISILDITIKPGIVFSSEEIEHLAQLAIEKDAAYWADAQSFV